MAVFEVKNLKFTYPEGRRPALAGIDLSVHAGEFLVMCGRSGCGKSTLLRHLKSVLTPFGERSGEVLYRDKPLEEATEREQAEKIGFVLQTPDGQIVTDKVWHELAFGLESLGFDKRTIRLRVAEMASFFGIQGWYHKNVTELSGGQKQLLNLAAVMAMQPEVLILDEPTSQLDPIAASDFLATVKKINDEIGTTVILSEHRLEEALPLADRVAVLSEGLVTAFDVPERVGFVLREKEDPMLYAMPAPMRAYLALEKGSWGSCPVTVREGKEYLKGYEGTAAAKSPPVRAARNAAKTADKVVWLQDVWFRYGKKDEDVIRDLNLEVSRGEMVCIVGGNGTGKTTALGVITGANKPYRGKVEVAGLNVLKANPAKLFEAGLGMLPQDPQCLFLRNTIREDLYTGVIKGDPGRAEREARIAEVVELTEIEDLLDMHPYDVSGGEQQRAALAKVLLTGPEILLLDEPTKGMDSFFKKKFADALARLRLKGVTVIMVSHDIEFCAVNADRCALFFDGGIVTENTPKKFFSGNSFYTTAANRMARNTFPEAITVTDVVEQCRLERQQKTQDFPNVQ